jgi:hypothetical protein
MIVRGQFKSLSEINTAPIMIVLRIDIPTQMGPSFISENVKFLDKNTIMYCLQKAVTEIISSHNCFLQLQESVLFYMAVDVSILSSVFLI